MVSAPVLAIPNFCKQSVVKTDASDCGIGAVLMQEGHPISYLSQPLSDRNRALSTYEKECIAILLAVDKWKCYLMHQEFLIRTDHRSLIYLTERKASTKLQQKALLKLMDLSFKIQHKKGITNAAADALSRNPAHLSIFSVSVCQPQWLQKLQEGYADDPASQQLLAKLSLGGGLQLKGMN